MFSFLSQGPLGELLAPVKSPPQQLHAAIEEHQNEKVGGVGGQALANTCTASHRFVCVPVVSRSTRSPMKRHPQPAGHAAYRRGRLLQQPGPGARRLAAHPHGVQGGEPGHGRHTHRDGCVFFLHNNIDSAVESA